MTVKTLSILYLLSLFCVLSQAATAIDVKGTIQYRQNYMNAISGHTGAIRRLKDGRFSAAGHLQMHTDALAKLTRDIALLFPEGTSAGKTDAKPEIWENWSDFEARAIESQQRHKPSLTQFNPGTPGQSIPGSAS